MASKTCFVCDKEFKRSFDAKRHEREVHGEYGVDKDVMDPHLCGVGEDDSSQFVFKHPFTAILAGPSSSGKTTLLKQVIEKRCLLIQPSPHRIVWYYKRWQPMYEELTQSIPGIEFKEGLPDPPTYSPFPVLFIIDDLMSTASQSDTISNLFTEGSHHLNISLFFIF